MSAKGLHEYRFKSNPHEQIAAELWQRDRHILADLLGDGTFGGRHHVEDREHQIAATLMQWLGSPVGRTWLRELNELFAIRDEVDEDARTERISKRRGSR